MKSIRTRSIGKKNIVIASALATMLLIRASFAYFVDRDAVTNHFTVGDVEISVSEPDWVPEDGELITPKKEIMKNPKITNDGANDAYVFMSVKIPRAEVQTAADDGSLIPAKEQDLFTYQINSNWKLIKTNQESDHSEYIYGYVDSNGKMSALKPGAATNALFDSVRFINIVEEQIDGQELDIDIDTMGIQIADLGTEDPMAIYNIIMNQQSVPN